MTFIDILMPVDSQEGTTAKVQNWLKSVGEAVSKDEPILELETDKVTMEIEAPGDGVITEILTEIGTEVAPGAVLGRISQQDISNTSPKDVQLTKKSFPASSSLAVSSKAGGKLSPSVRRYVDAHDLNVSAVIGSGKGGRLTLSDVKAHHKAGEGTTSIVAPSIKRAPSQSSNTAPPLSGSSQLPHSKMRLAIAKHMSHSVAVAPHVTAVFEADFSAIAAHRAAHKASFAQQGVKLTYSAYLVMACAAAMRAVPQVNSRWHDDHLEVFSDINIGVGTALGDDGLIVPVLKNTQDQNLLGIAKNLQNMIDLARQSKLKPADVQGGTFTISNHGVSGSLVATPIIINQPQSAILGVGKLEKRVTVKTIDGQDVIAVRPMAFVSLTIDHRALDGHQTNTWLQSFVNTLENWTL